MLAQNLWWIMVAVMGLTALVLFLTLARFIRLYLMAFFARAEIGFGQLIGMALRKVDPDVIVVSKIRAVQAGLEVATADMERHYLAGRNVPNVVTLMAAAKEAGAALAWEQAVALDLAGEDLPALAQQLRDKRAVNARAVLPGPGHEDIT